MLARLDHHLVVLGVGGDGAFLAVALQSDVAVLVAFHARESPVANTVLIAQGGVVMPLERLGYSLRMDSGQRLERRQLPESSAVGEVGVGEQDDGEHVLQRQSASLVGVVEAVGTIRRRNDYGGALSVASEDGLEEVGLFGLGGESCAGTAALHINDHKRQLCHDGEPDSLRLEREPGTGGGGAG